MVGYLTITGELEGESPVRASSGGATRTVALVLLIAVLMLSLPSFQIGNQTVKTNPTGDATASAGDRSLKVSVLGLTGAVSTLNPLLLTENAEWDVVYPCYSQLLQYDLEGTSAGNVGGGNTMTGDLATSWDVSPDGLTYHFELTRYAKFYNRLDPAGVNQNHPFTADDVIYTFWLIQNTTSNLMSYFPIINTVKLIKSMVAPDPYNLYITTSFPFAPFLDAVGTVPILPKYIWDQYVPMNPAHGAPFAGWSAFANFDISANIAPCVGTGMFYYMLNGMPSTGQNVELDRNPQWYATEEKGWQVHVNKLIWTSETSQITNLNDFTAGATDVMMYVSPTQFSQTLTQPYYVNDSKWGASLGYVYEFNLNQMTDTQRTQLGGKFGSGKNNQLLLDPTVKLAMQMAIDKNSFVDLVLHGLGQPADSIVPPVNPYHYTYGSSPQDHIVAFDPAAARALLNSAGWNYDTAGNFNPGATPLCQIGGSTNKPLRFNFYTPSNEPEWDTGAKLIIGWMAQAGVDLSTDYALKSVNQMNGIWAAADYDTWLWNWEWSALAEVSVDVMHCFTTQAIGSWSDMYWSNATFDALYDESIVTVDRTARRVITDQMQRMVYDEHACQTPAYKKYLYAATSRGPEQWTNWGDWSKYWLLIPDQHVAPYLYMQIFPKDNPAPQSTSFQKTYNGTTTAAVRMTGSFDQPTVQYRWFYGDGTRDPTWTTSALRDHPYTKDGVYTAYLAVQQTTGADRFISSFKTTVTVIDTSNLPPTSVGFSSWSKNSPGYPDTGSLVYLNGSATDPEGNPLYYSWNFGDGQSALGQNVVHQFTKGPSTVTLSVDDRHLGLTPRPVSYPGLIPVVNNTRPSISVPDVTGPIPKQSSTYWATTIDPDVNDLHTYTWVWGDGSFSVTKTPPLANDSISTSHTYPNAGIYTMVVYADDLTGLPGHNYSDSGQVLCKRGVNTAPTITAFSLNNNVPVRFQTVTFTGTAYDTDADNMYWKWDYGDGTNSTIYVPVNNKNPVTYTSTHSYLTSGVKVARLYVTDGFLTTTSTQIPINVNVGDHEPVVQALSAVRVTVGRSHTYTCSATDVDGDPLTYWWQFGDGTNMSGQTVTKTFSSSTGQFGTWYRVWVNDNNLSSLVGPMNVSASNTVIANWIPWITNPLPNVNLNTTYTATLSVTAMDNDTIENTSLQFAWNFGDGSPFQVVTGTSSDPNPSVVHAYGQPGTYQYAVYVSDLYVDTDAVSHNVSKTATVQIAFTLILSPGWNMVSLPLVGFGYKASTLGLLTDDIVTGWNGATYNQTYIVGRSPARNDFAIAENTGYWIYAGGARTIHLWGSGPTGTQTKMVTVPAGGGWYIIGFSGFNATRHASDIKTMYAGGAVTTVAWYDTVNATYKTYIGTPRTDFQLSPGWGIWIYVTASGTLSYSP